VPLVFNSEGLDSKIVEKLGMWTKAPDLGNWKNLIEKIKQPKKKVKIAVVGKYVQLTDSYKSLNEALIHGGIANDAKVELDFVDSEALEEKDIPSELKGVDGILVPGGFGRRGIEGMIRTISYARENKIPFFGICLGMQVAVIEMARNLLGHKDANSTEFQPETAHPVISLMEEQKGVDRKGATMRLGKYPCTIKYGSLAYKSYDSELISERHRHRYEFNNEYMAPLTKIGVEFSGIYTERQLVEIMELKNHPWFLGCQFHPEFKSKPMTSHPLFREFIKASLAQKEAKA
jgi:CTP synthase